MCAHVATEDKTLPLTVKNIGFLLDRLGQDCHPLQFLRELTQNAIEAIQGAGEPGAIVWDVEWNQYDLKDGVFKLCCIDTGVGMTGSEMVEYINQLSSSIGEQSFSGRFGVGAKIAAAPRNPHGIIYQSWKAGEGAMIHLWRNPGTGQYGLRQFPRSDATYGHSLEIDDALKSQPIKEHGTVVILLGGSDEDDTMRAPEGARAPSRWIAKYLNTRYFKFPDGVTVKAREGWENPRSDSKRNKLRTVTGQAKYLANHSQASGKVRLSGATAHWWILKKTDALTQESNYYASAGHIAALYQDELYEMVTARAATAKLQQFGAIFGSRQVVIYVQPDAEGVGTVTPNTARTQLLVDNQFLPWDQWAAEFRKKMPRKIDELVREHAAASVGTDHTKAIRERLKPLLDLYKLTRYRPSLTGAVMVDDAIRVRGGRPAGGGGTRGGGSEGPGYGGRAGSLYSLFEKKNGVRGDIVHPDLFPDVKWISAGDGTREKGDLEDRAARFIKDQNLLLINADFRVFTDLIKKWCSELGDAEEYRDTVIDVVRNWFEQALVETVIGVQALEGSPEWTTDHVKQALSEEALTTAVMQRYHVNNSVKRELGSKLGKLSAA